MVEPLPDDVPAKTEQQSSASADKASTENQDPFATKPDDTAQFATKPGLGASPTVAVLPTIPGYLLLEEIGRGGMGIVFKARQAGLNRLVALKMISSGMFLESAHRARFLGEARAIASL